MVEVVGTAPTSAMVITKFVYRHSWKTNIINIKLVTRDSISLFKMKLTKEQQQEIADQQAKKNVTKRVTSPELAIHISSKSKILIKKMIKGEKYDFESSGLSKRE